MTASRNSDEILVVCGPRGDFEALMKQLDHEHFPYHPDGLAAARAYDVIREALDAVIEDSGLVEDLDSEQGFMLAEQSGYERARAEYADGSQQPRYPRDIYINSSKRKRADARVCLGLPVEAAVEVEGIPI